METENLNEEESPALQQGAVAYLVRTKHLELVVIANNIADACDKLESKGYKEYEFIFSRSFDILH